ncbi:glucosamine-6-phosphate deaminase [Mesoterricola sediminis]|uniref:Glucosamine-6-phosphate deaminase n=1 Tax=Mesoterricola sediminis TaxID=2927980 RepID=A0AA48GVQ7_9BACT|nr:glucosamine-6-phosphate deaminase [Mesoterricola sediminis]BDU76525.1 glucosamine-6-phosphate deaminase [Mesoterricola sediminis]
MEIAILDNADKAAARAAEHIAQALAARPALVLGLATGRTMEAVYRHLVRIHRETGLDFSRCRTFNLDEYLGLGPDHPGSYHRYMEEHLFRHVNLRPGNTHLPDGAAPDPEAECRDYERRIREAGGIDLQLLGLGVTGHIGFNEPPAPFDAPTRVVDLDPRTRAQNAGVFPGGFDAVPRRALTMGVGTILAARSCLLLVTGASKAPILQDVLRGPASPAVPASALQRHPRCLVLADPDAAWGAGGAWRREA